MLCYVANEMYDMKCICYEVNKKEKLNYNSSEKLKLTRNLCLGWIVFQKFNSRGGWNKNVLGGKKLKNQLAGGGRLLGTKEYLDKEGKE